MLKTRWSARVPVLVASIVAAGGLLAGCNLILGIEDLSNAGGSSGSSVTAASSSGTACGDPCLSVAWALPIGSTADDHAHELAVDASGTSFFAGDVTAASTLAGAPFGPGVFVAAVLPTGTPVAMGQGDWPLSLPGRDPRVALSPAGGFIAADFDSSIVLNGTTYDGPGAYVIRVGAAGHIVDARVFDATAAGASVDVRGVTAIPDGVLVYGQFTGSVNFGVLGTKVSQSSGADGFVAALTTSPWIHTYTGMGVGTTTVNAVVQAKNGDLILTGRRMGATSFPTPAPAGAGLFVARLSSDGNTSVAPPRTLETGGYGRSLSLRSDGGVILTGASQDKSLLFPLPSGSKTVPPKTAFVARLDPTNAFVFVIPVPGVVADEIVAGVSPLDNVFVTGSFAGTLSFDNQAPQASKGGTDMFVALLDANSGGHLASRTFGAGLDDHGAALGLSPGSLTVAGSFTGDVDFDGTKLTSMGAGDAVVVHFAGLEKY
ncbi:MAG: hypothetical protein U0414_09000 [Polyangiaceae bacterium]